MKKSIVAALAGLGALAIGQLSAAAPCNAPKWDETTQYHGSETVVYDSAHFFARYWVKGERPDRDVEWSAWEFLEDCDLSVYPIAGTYNKSKSSTLSFELNVQSNLTAITNDTLGTPLGENDFLLNTVGVEISSAYLASLPIGTYSYSLHFSDIEPLQITLDVVDVPMEIDACQAPAWDSQYQYHGSELVSYDGAHFMARYWVKGASPDRNVEWDAWKFIEDCDPGIPPIYNNGVQPSSQDYFKEDASPLTFTLLPDNGVSFVRILNVDEAYYQVDGNQLVIASEFLDTLTSGVNTFTLDYNLGNDVSISINVIDPPVYENDVQPSSQNYLKGVDSSLTFTLLPDTGVSFVDVIGVGQANYGVNGDQLVIFGEFLDGLSVGEHIFTVDYSLGNDVVISVNVSDSPSYENSVQPSTQDYVKGVDDSLTFTLLPDTGVSFVDVLGVGQANYEVNGDQLLIYSEFLDGLSAGVNTFTVDYNLGNDVVISVNVSDPPSYDNAVQPSSQDYFQGVDSSLTFTLVPDNGVSFLSVVGMGAEDYEVNGDQLLIYGAFLDGLSAGTTAFTVDFDLGNDVAISINVIESPPEPSISPSQRTFKKGSSAGAVFTLDTDGDQFVSLINSTNGETLLGSDFSIVGSSLEVSATYLSTLPAGSYLFDINFAESDALGFAITVTLPEPVVSPSQFTYKKGTSETAEFSLELDGDMLESVINQSTGAMLMPGDFAVDNTSLQIFSNYLSSLDEGQYELALNFGEAEPVVVVINVILPSPVISPTTYTFNKGFPSSAIFNLTLDDDTLMSIVDETAGIILTPADFTFDGSQLAILPSYLSSLAVGDHVFYLNFKESVPLVITIKVVDPIPTDGSVLLPASAILSGDAVLENDVIDLRAGVAEWSFVIPISGEYRIELDYTSPHGQKTNTFFIANRNEQLVTPESEELQTHSVTLNIGAGEHTLGVNGSGTNWGYIYIHQIRIIEVEILPRDPVITPSLQSFIVTDVRPLSYSVEEGDYAFVSLSNDGAVMVPGFDYNYQPGSMTLRQEFLDPIPAGTEYALTAEFYSEVLELEKSVVFNVRADAEPIVEPSLTPAQADISIINVVPVSFELIEGSFELSGVTHTTGEVLDEGVDFTFVEGVLTIEPAFLETLDVGSYPLAVNLSSALSGSRELGVLINVLDVPPPQACYDVSSIIVEGDTQVDEEKAKVTGKTGSEAYWLINLEKSGQYELQLTYSTEGGDKKATYVLNDGGLSGMTWPDASVNSPKVLNFVHELQAGVHKVGMANREGDWGWASVHQLCPVFKGSLNISSPQPFDQLPSGSDIAIEFQKDATGALTYSVNGAPLHTYSGESPLIIPGNGDGLYDIELGIVGTQINTTFRVQVGEAPGPHFVDTLGTQFVYGNAPFYYNGTNQYYLMYKPEAQSEDFFQRAKYLGMNVVRTWMFCNDDRTHDGVCINMKSGDDFILAKANRTPEESALVARSYELFDNYVWLAHEYDQKLVLSLADHWDFFGNLESYGPNPYSNREAIDEFKEFIGALLSHFNPLTGYTYAEDPAIMMWELANEPRCSNSCNAEIFKAWVEEISSYIKSLAPHHLVSIGAESSFGFNGTNDDFNFVKEVNSPVTIDAISAHLYPTWWNMSDEETLGNFDQLAAVGRALNKPTYVGEFSWPVNSPSSVTVDLERRTQVFADWYEKAEEHSDVIGGMLAWQLSGKEWGNGGVPLKGCQWCSGPYGEPTDGWAANNDGFQIYCAINEEEASLTETGASGTNKEGSTIHIDLHKPVCDILIERSAFYKELNEG